MRKLFLGVQFALLACACGAQPAAAATGKSKFVIRGAGYGHGVGMSQFGAYGFAKHGYGYASILGHYYTGTSLGALSPTPEVRVLLRQGTESASFTGATRVGDRALDPANKYSVVRSGVAALELRSPSGRTLATYQSPMRVESDGQLLVLRGTAINGVANGRYRGALEFRPGLFGGVNSINALPLEDYVRGVISGESPASWPAEALKAQAVAARTYAITTNAGGTSGGFDQYPDTRSQVYRGVAAERPSTDAAVAATAGQVVTYAGKPVVTYFFSTSGGETENVENVFLKSKPQPWLKGVADPFDDASPKHRWGPISLTGGQAARKLRGLVSGGFRGIKVIKRGVSPRVVRAQVLGTKGRTEVTGPELRKRLGLLDTWAYYRYISSKTKKKPAAPAPAEPQPTTTGDSTTGGTEPPPPAPPPPMAISADYRPVVGPSIAGTIFPGRFGAWLRVQAYRGAGRWETVVWATLGRGGRYHVTLPAPGLYRVLFDGSAGPTVRAR